MGACASVVKSMRAEAGSAPPPEPAKEETTTAVAASTTEVVEVKTEGEVKGEGEEEKKVVAGEAAHDDNPQSLGSLLNESPEEVKETLTTEKEIIPSETEKKEEAKEESLPVSDVVVAEAPTETKVEPVQVEAKKETVQKEQS